MALDVFKDSVDGATGEEHRKKVVTRCIEKIDEIAKNRGDFIRRVNKWRRQREAIPEVAEKSFPWPKASNVVIPLALTDTNALTSSMKAAFSTRKPFFHVTPMNDTRIKEAEVLEKYLSRLVESKHHLNLREINNEIFYDLTSLGTQVVSVPWLTDVHTFKRQDERGNWEKITVTKHDGPAVISHLIEDIFIDEYMTDPEYAPFIGIRHNLTWYELKQREEQMIYENVDDIKDAKRTKLEENQEEEGSRIGLESGTDLDLYEIFECYLYEDVDGDGFLEDVKIWIERSTGTVLREELNGLGVRDIVRIPFIVIPRKFYGMGVGWICEHPQDAMDALFNMAVNSTHISSLQMMVTKKGGSLGMGEKFFPFKQIAVENPREDFMPITFPNTAAANLSMINFIQSYTDRAVGANNAMQGYPDTFAKSRSTASGYMFQAQQSSRLFDAVLENVELGFGKISMLLVFQLIQNKEKVNYGLLSVEDGEILKRVLDMKPEDIPLNFGFTVTSTEVEQTEEAKRQQILTLSQLYSMYAQQNLGLIQSAIQVVTPLAQQNPQPLMQLTQRYLEAANQFTVGSTNLMGKILDTLNVERSGYLLYVKDIDMMLKFMSMMKDMQLTGGGGNGIQGSGRQVGGPVLGGGQAPGGIVEQPAAAGGPQEGVQEPVEPGGEGPSIGP